jgi:3-oxoadipate enol-lactonase
MTTTARLDVETFGAGADVVLLHSLLTDRSSFLPLARLLAATRRVSLVSLPGFGASPPAEPLAGYAASVADFCAGLPGRPDIIGNGLGSFVALTLAARHGDRIGRLALIGAAIAFPEAGRATFRALAEKAERDGMAPIADAAMARMFPEDFIAAHADLIAERKAVFLRIVPSVFAAASRALATLDLAADLPRIANSVLVMTGDKDTATPPALGRALAERLPDGHFIALPGLGHAPHLQDPERVLATLAPFLGISAAA